MHQLSHRCTAEDGLTLSHRNKLSLRTKYRRKSSIFFDTIKRWSEQKMEQFNSTRHNSISETIIFSSTEWSDDRWKVCFAAVGIQTKMSVLLWHFGINHLSPCSSRTFWKQSHWSYIAGQRVVWTWNIPLHLPRGKQISIFIQLSSMDWYLEVRIWPEDNLCSSYLLIQEKEDHKDP